MSNKKRIAVTITKTIEYPICVLDPNDPLYDARMKAMSDFEHGLRENTNNFRRGISPEFLEAYAEEMEVFSFREKKEQNQGSKIKYKKACEVLAKNATEEAIGKKLDPEVNPDLFDKEIIATNNGNNEEIYYMKTEIHKIYSRNYDKYQTLLSELRK